MLIVVFIGSADVVCLLLYCCTVALQTVVYLSVVVLLF